MTFPCLGRFIRDRYALYNDRVVCIREDSAAVIVSLHNCSWWYVLVDDGRLVRVLVTHDHRIDTLDEQIWCDGMEVLA